MTVTDQPTDSELTTTAGYRRAIDAATDEDQQFATEVSNQIIEVVKAFSAVKGRLHGSSDSANFDFALLIKLAKAGPMRASDLAEKLCFDPSTVSRQVAGLVKAGMLERKADPADGRASILVPTEAGLDRVDSMLRRRGQLFAPIVAHWSDDDRAAFKRLLTEFAHGLSTTLEAVKNVASDMIREDALPHSALVSQGRNA